MLGPPKYNMSTSLFAFVCHFECLKMNRVLLQSNNSFQSTNLSGDFKYPIMRLKPVGAILCHDPLCVSLWAFNWVTLGEVEGDFSINILTQTCVHSLIILPDSQWLV